MGHNLTTKLSNYPVEIAMRSGEFQLLPSNPALPVILSQPVKNINQYTWIISTEDGVPTYQNIAPTSDILDMLQGTSFSFMLRPADPAIVGNPSDLSGLSFRWKKDDVPLYDLNNQNDGNGVSGLYVVASDSVPSLSGVYTCEVSNVYGTVESSPLEVNIINPLKHPKLYKNLILNGDGDGGLNGWQADGDIIVRPFLQKINTTKNFGSFRLGQFIMIGYNENDTYDIPSEFYFSLSSHSSLFYNSYLKRSQSDPTFADINIKSDPTKYLDDSYLWIVEGVMPQIVPNEDYNKSEFAGFFPGLLWMDQYNKNTSNNLIGLYTEFKNTNPTYFTRDKLRFEKFGGKRLATISQTVDVSDLANFIDGSVYGVKYLTSQFFAYVGVGITDYKIRVQTKDGPKLLNYYINDSEIVYDRLVGSVNPNFPEIRDVSANSRTYIDPRNKIELLPDTDIEIIPQCYDKTTITLTYLDDRNQSLKVETVDGPDESDIWAVKEKVYFPLTLWSLFEFVQPNNNNIKVFGQKYTNTNAISTLFTSNFLDYDSPAVKEKYRAYKNDIDSKNDEIIRLNKEVEKNGYGVELPPIILFKFEDWKNIIWIPNISNSLRGIFGTNWSKDSSPELPYTITDKAFKFFLNKFDFTNPGWRGSYPGDIWYTIEYYRDKNYYYKALQDYGAAAMFGVGKNVVIPKNTKSIKIDVTFNHNSSIQSDTNPELKNWQSQELYTDEYGQNSGKSRRLVEYGYPRCGVTKMKMVVTPNDPKISEETVSYNLPPATSTVLGLQKNRYADPDAHNTDDGSPFKYEILQPRNVPIPTNYVNPYLTSKESAQYITAQQSVANNQPLNAPSLSAVTSSNMRLSSGG
jgi:hypothetical protein